MTMNPLKSRLWLIPVVLTLLLTCCKREQVMNDIELKSFSESVKAEDIRLHIALLADDSFDFEAGRTYKAAIHEQLPDQRGRGEAYLERRLLF